MTSAAAPTIYWIVFLNGLYDIFCAAALLDIQTIFTPPFINAFFRSFHLSMFSAAIDPCARRLLAYWVATYGMIRISWWWPKKQKSAAHASHTLVAASYYLESAAIINEYINGTIPLNRAVFVAFSCLIIAWRIVCNVARQV